jgi:hypothetical protein
VFVSFFPWSIKLPSLLKRLWHKHDKIDCYLFSGAAIIFIIFSLLKTKLPHYTLPAFGMMALLLARHVFPEQASSGKAAGSEPSGSEELNQAGSTVTGSRSSFTAMAVATACVWIAIALVVPPLVARFFPAYQLFRESRAHLQPTMQFASVEFEEPSLVWYFRSRVKAFLTRINKKSAINFMSEPGPRFVVVPTSLVEGLFPNPPEAWSLFPANGFNIPKGKKVELTLVLKEE